MIPVAEVNTSVGGRGIASACIEIQGLNGRLADEHRSHVLAESWPPTGSNVKMEQDLVGVGFRQILDRVLTGMIMAVAVGVSRAHRDEAKLVPDPCASAP